MNLLPEFSEYQHLYKQGFRFDPVKGIFFTSGLKKDFIAPPGFENWEVQEFDRNEYLKARLSELGISETENSVELRNGAAKYNTQIFTSNKYGDIEILQYSLRRVAYTYEAGTTSAGTRVKFHGQKRLHPNYASFCEGKYDGSDLKIAPFWHPDLIAAFETESEIPTLTITEGQIKAFKATKEGVPTVGFTSISHFRDPSTLTMHPEVIEFIRVCSVQRIVVLWDGDCREISVKALKDKSDLSKRPYDFYNYACRISELIYEFFSNKKRLSIYFATINSRLLVHHPKGLDDLFLHYGFDASAIVDEFKNIGKLPGTYITWKSLITKEDKTQLYGFFALNSVNSFYRLHTDVIGTRQFVFRGSTYNVVDDYPQESVPAELKQYIRVGDHYYRFLKTPLPMKGKPGKRLHEDELTPWKIETIRADFGHNADRFIEKYDAFVNEPNHTDFQQVIETEEGRYWNLYYNVGHTLQRGDFPHIKMLLKNLFGEHFANEMIYDYFSLLWHKPWQKLPIVGLVSRSNNTGKSTFMNLLFAVFKRNVVFVSSEELLDRFNSHWATALIVCNDESMIDKKQAYNRLKNYSLSQFISRHEKGVTAKPVSNNMHFVLNSNDEEDFIKLPDSDTRFWIRKAPPISEKIAGFDDLMLSEIPQFVEFIHSRTLKYDYTGDRMYFAPEDFQTDAFRRIVSNSEPHQIKDLRLKLEEYFSKWDDKTLTCTVADLRQYFNIVGEDFYLNKIIKEYLKVEKQPNAFTYSFRVDIVNEPQAFHIIKGRGKYLTFKREDFITPEPEQGKLKL